MLEEFIINFNKLHFLVGYLGYQINNWNESKQNIFYKLYQRDWKIPFPIDINSSKKNFPRNKKKNNQNFKIIVNGSNVQTKCEILNYKKKTWKNFVFSSNTIETRKKFVNGYWRIETK